MEGERVDVASLSETMWKNDSAFETGDWYLMGTGSGVSKGQAVIVLLSKRRFCRAHVRFQAEFPGRILHVRITVGCSSIDVVAAKAGEFLKLYCIAGVASGILARLPRRNRLIIGGDFNCPLLQHSPPYVGPGAQPLLSNNSQDQEDFQNMIVQNDYCVLNTWMPLPHTRGQCGPCRQDSDRLSGGPTISGP